MLALFVVILVLSLINGFSAWSAANRAAGFFPRTTWIYAFFGVLFCLELSLPIFLWSVTSLFTDAPFTVPVLLSRLAYLSFGFSSCFFVYAVVAELFCQITAWGLPLVVDKYLSLFFLAVTCGATLTTLGIGFINTRQVDVREVEVAFPNLPAAFDGYRIVQLTDLHIGPFIDGDYVREVVTTTQSLRPDLIVFTGDIADGKLLDLAGFVDFLRPLHAKDGEYFVSGNHEYYMEPNTWINYVRSLGKTVLMNNHVVLQRKKARLVLGGVPDPAIKNISAADRPDIARTFKGAEKDFKILLSHQPRLFKKAANEGVDLQLSGHTHAGQYFPFTWIIALFQPYVDGLYRVDGHALYVNGGTGFWGPPIRTGRRGEITLLTLRLAKTP